MKVLIDEMDDGWDDSLRILGYDAYSVKKLRAQGHTLGDDNSVINYARENGMILVTRDNKSGSDCKKAGIPCILLDSDELFRLVREKLGEYGSPTGLPQVINPVLRNHASDLTRLAPSGVMHPLGTPMLRTTGTACSLSHEWSSQAPPLDFALIWYSSAQGCFQIPYKAPPWMWN